MSSGIVHVEETPPVLSYLLGFVVSLFVRWVETGYSHICLTVYTKLN